MDKVKKTKFNWAEIGAAELTLELARLKAPKLKDREAADQIATALHEAIHLVVAVSYGIYVSFIGVSVKPNGSAFFKGKESLGICLAFDYDEGYETIQSTCLAAIFELELSDRADNGLVQSELEAASRAAGKLLPHEKIIDLTPEQIVEQMMNQLTGNSFDPEQGPLGQSWWLIRTVAIAVLMHRDRKNGSVSSEDTNEICMFVKKYCALEVKGLNEILPAEARNYCMRKDIATIKALVKIQREYQSAQLERWLDKNDLDRIHEKWKTKQNKSIRIN